MAIAVKAHGSTGELMDNQVLYSLQAAPVDPSNTEISFTGRWSHGGKIVLRVSDPNTTCVAYQGQSICGNRAIDSTFTFNVLHRSGSRSDITLDNVVDTPGPQNTGVVSDVKVSGYWDRNGDVEIYLSYKLTPYNKGVSAYAVVGIKSYYVGKVNNRNEYTGNAFMRGNAYLVVNGVYQIDPYQMVIVPFEPMASGVVNLAVPHRGLSPYSTTNPSKPVAGREVTGVLSNVVYGVGDKFTADAWLYTPNDGASFNRTGVIEGAMYQVPRHSNLHHIYASKFVDAQGSVHVFDNANVIIDQ